jgi:hypothetical protein
VTIQIASRGENHVTLAGAIEAAKRGGFGEVAMTLAEAEEIQAQLDKPPADGNAIDISVQQASTDDLPYAIGSAIPPDALFLDTRSEEDGYWTELVGILWAEWFEKAEGVADTDSEFVNWLVSEKDWQPAESRRHVTIFT